MSIFKISNIKSNVNKVLSYNNYKRIEILNNPIKGKLIFIDLKKT